MNAIKSDQDIINELILILENNNKDSNGIERSNDKLCNEIIQNVPKLVLFMESNYKHLKGTSKKQLIIDTVKAISIKMGYDDAEIESYVTVIPYIIDGLVYLGNNSGSIFAKMKKSKFICC